MKDESCYYPGGWLEPESPYPIFDGGADGYWPSGGGGGGKLEPDLPEI